MVSSLWLASSEGDLDKVRELLKESSNTDIEVRDHTGATPLIQAIKNGHVDVVSELLDHGADHTSAFNHGRFDQYTSDPVILDLLRRAQDKMVPHENSLHEGTFQHDPNEDTDKHYYGHPPGAYPYYPTLNAAPPLVGDGASVYYPPPPPQGSAENSVSGGLGNLPPPEIARSIPCRYFPACRYGSSCMFAHPQTPYFQGPAPPPGQYMPYDPSLGPQPYGPNYYSVPPTFQQPNGVPHMAPLSPPPGPPPLAHGRSHSEVISNPYSPGGISPLPYGAMLPSVYPPQGQMPIPIPVPPLSNVHPHPPLQHPVPQSPTAVYNQLPIPNSVYNGQPDGPYALPLSSAPVPYVEAEGDPNLSSVPQNDGFTHGPQGHRDGMSHGRRGGGGRRGSFSSRKPPCIFYPSGRCKNGDDCRFPHILPDGSASQNPYYSNRGGARMRGNSAGNGFTGMDEKFANLHIRDDQSRPDGLFRSGDNGGHGGRTKYDRGFRHHGGNMNGSHIGKKPPIPKQRVPDADEFPVLGGSTTPPNRQPNGGPTAAQVLQAPPPVGKGGSHSGTRGTTPDSPRANGTQESSNGLLETVASPATSEQKIAVSFAAAASSTDIAKEVAVSA
ncbi:hypothetical protein AX15_001563 [Amanita polypyramis BW_CC]|nr:hypothetical protein AX15_001563 [Amanita polypyramis BW_CC]